jgi:hypothetical protein
MDHGRHGYALLIAANPPGRQPAVHATAALPTLAAVPPATLLGLPTGNVVQLTDPADPQTVLTHLRTAAAHQGPVLLYLAGQLVLDARQRLPHLALAGPGGHAVRYTGLPWHWISAELAGRAPDSVTVVADLVADADAWAKLRADPSPLSAGLTLYGALSAPAGRRHTAAPLYSQALAAVLRSASVRMPDEELHQVTAAHAGLGGSTGPDGREALLLGGAYGAGAPPHYGSRAPAPGAAGGAGASAAHGANGPYGAGDAHGVAGAADAARTGAGWTPPPRPPGPPGQSSPSRSQDPHETIFNAAREGRHGEAVAIASAWEQAALRAGGPASPEAVHWVEVRADLARLSGDPARSCALWLHAAAVRLQMGQDPSNADVFGAVDRAHHCWHLIEDTGTAGELGPRLAELREWAPGRQPGAVEDVRARLRVLQGEPRHRPDGAPR